MSGGVELTYTTAERKSRSTSMSFPIELSDVAFHRLALLPVSRCGITTHSASRLQTRSSMYSLASCQTPLYEVKVMVALPLRLRGWWSTEVLVFRNGVWWRRVEAKAVQYCNNLVVFVLVYSVP